MNNLNPQISRDIVKYDKIAGYLSAERKSFRKGDVIIRLNMKSDTMGIVDQGLACMLSISVNGEKSIMEYYTDGNIFGTAFTPESNANLHYIYARKDCNVYLFSENCLNEFFLKADNDYKNKLNTMFIATIKKSHIHNDILLQRTIREKLMMYFRYSSSTQNSQSFTIPLTLSDLSDYLAADRSAMMRELKKMNNEHIISSKGQNITIL